MSSVNWIFALPISSLFQNQMKDSPILIYELEGKDQVESMLDLKISPQACHSHLLKFHWPKTVLRPRMTSVGQGGYSSHWKKHKKGM